MLPAVVREIECGSSGKAVGVGREYVSASTFDDLWWLYEGKRARSDLHECREVRRKLGRALEACSLELGEDDEPAVLECLIGELVERSGSRLESSDESERTYAQQVMAGIEYAGLRSDGPIPKMERYKAAAGFLHLSADRARRPDTIRLALGRLDRALNDALRDTDMLVTLVESVRARAARNGSAAAPHDQRRVGIPENRDLSLAGNAAKTQVVLPAGALTPAQDVACPPGVVQLRSVRSDRLFVGREAELAALNEAVTTTGVGVVTQAITGLGGVGKSTLAEHYAWSRRETFNPVWWITAEDQAGVDAGLAGLAARLDPFLAALPTSIAAAWTTGWLAAHEGWLVVLDNATEPNLIADVIQRLPLGRFLVTSRLSVGWHGVARPLLLDVLTDKQAVELLTRIAAGTVPDMTGAEALCAELGFLPLAVEQVGAYLAQSGMSPTEYLERLAKYPAAMYRQVPEGGDASRTIARIWHATLDRIADTPLCGQILRMLAFCAPDAIPRSVLDVLGTPPEVEHAVSRLAAYSLVTTDRHTLAIHRLVQAVFRTPDTEDPHRTPSVIAEARNLVTDCLAAALPSDLHEPAAQPVWQALLPHIEAVANHTAAADDTATTARLLNRTGQYLEKRGNVDRAIGWLQRALTASERVLGPSHPLTLLSRHNLANAYRSAGNLRRSIELHQQNLAERERTHGTDHRDTLASRGNLAGAYRLAGDIQRAIPLYRQILADRERVLGTDDPDTLASRSNLAGAYRSAGDLQRAIELFQQALTDYERVLGADHASTMTARNNLAQAYREDHNLQRAIELHQQTLADCERVLGADHSLTLVSRNNLAGAYVSARDLGRGIELYQQNLARYGRALGSDHPVTLTSRNNLAHAYKLSGDLQRAIALYELTLADRERVLGMDDPNTIASRSNLAGAYESAGDSRRAIELFRQALADCERVLGADHPSTLTLRNNLAHAYGSVGDAGRAIELYQQNLADSERVLGIESVDTLMSRSNLASAYRSAGDLPRAVELYRQTLADCERVLGPNNPTTRLIRTKLADLLREDPPRLA